MLKVLVMLNKRFMQLELCTVMVKKILRMTTIENISKGLLMLKEAQLSLNLLDSLLHI